MAQHLLEQISQVKSQSKQGINNTSARAVCTTNGFLPDKIGTLPIQNISVPLLRSGGMNSPDGGTTNNGLYREALPKRGTFFRLWGCIWKGREFTG